MIAKIMMLLVFFAITIGVGLYCRKNATNVGDFVLGGRNVGPWMSAFSFGTAYFSAVVFVGYAGQFGWNFGMSVTWIGIGNALVGSLLAWVVLGRRTRIMTKHLEASTMPDFFAKRYDSQLLKVAVSAVIFLFLIPYSASVYKGLSELFAMAFGVDITYCIIVMAVLTAFYIILGGYIAEAMNDLIQGVIMLVGIVAVVVVVINSQGGLMAAAEKLSQVPCESNPALEGAYVSFLGPDPLLLLSVFILTSLGTWGLPQMVHKFYSIRNEKAIRIGTVISTVFAAIIAGGSYFLGSFGRLFYQPEADGRVVYDSIIPTMLEKALPDLLIGLVIIMVLAASMSTLAALVMASSSTFTLDFLKGTLARNMKEKTSMLLIKGFCAVFVLLSVIIALNPNSLITSLMSLSWGVLAGSFLGPFLYGLFWKRANKWGLWACIITAVGINMSNLMWAWTAPLKAGALAIVLSLVVAPLVSLLTPRLPGDFVEGAFYCFEEKVEVVIEQKALLVEEESEK
ncbi:MAG: sodium/solute symporter [Bacillota bacterium]|nr:sodium/solute symporter [Bacillota bacterium]